MPDWNEILDELNAYDAAAHNKYDTIRRRYLKDLHNLTGRNVIAYYSGCHTSIESGFSITSSEARLNSSMTPCTGIPISSGSMGPRLECLPM